MNYREAIEQALSLLRNGNQTWAAMGVLEDALKERRQHQVPHHPMRRETDWPRLDAAKETR